MKTLVKNNRGITLVVVLMIMAILLSMIGAGLLFSGINTKIASNYHVGTKAFYAADTGINAVVSSLTLTPTFSSTPVSLGNNLCYRFGKRDGTVPSSEPQIRSGAGFSVGSGTGYNASGYVFHQYQINVTGTFSPSSTCPAANSQYEMAAREIEAQASFGPVPQ